MQIPSEFKAACQNMGPGLDEFATSLDDLVRIALNGIGLAESKAISKFLDDLSSKQLSADQLKEFWWSTPATTVFHRGEDVAAFLMRMREILALPPYGEVARTS